MAATWVIKAVDVLEDGGVGLPAGRPAVPPNQFGFDGFEERLDSGIVITITLTAHGRQQCASRRSNCLDQGHAGVNSALI